MSVGFLVSDLQDRVRWRCGLPAFTSDTNVTTSDVLSLAKESVRRLCSLMSAFSPEAYFAETAELTTTPGEATLSLPQQFAQLLQIFWAKSPDQNIPLRQANLEAMGPLDPRLTWDTMRPVYRLQAETLEFWPTPQSAHTVSLRYSTGLFPTAASDTVYLELGWDEWIVLDMCCKIRQRQEKSYSEFAGERAQALQDIQDVARRDRAGYAQTRDVRGDDHWQDPAGDWWRL